MASELIESDADETAGADEGDSEVGRLAEVHERAMRRFDQVAMPQQEQRAQSLSARRFVTVPGAMWEGTLTEWAENTPRPEVDKITRSLEKIETDFRENRVIANFRAADDIADADTADLLDGLFRADAYHYKAAQAYDNAFAEGIRGGFGAWRLCTEYANPDDPDDESQRVNPGVLIADADQSVYFDPASKTYDKSDAEWAFVVVADPRETAIEQWGASNIEDWPLRQWRWAWDWFQPDMVRTAEYYECEHVKDRRITLANNVTGETERYWQSEIDAAELRDLEAQGFTKSTRMMKRKRVRKYLMNGMKVLEDCGYIAGDMIPIVPFYGRRDYVDNQERWRGHVQKKIDAQRIYNTHISKLVEISALSPLPVPVVAPEQMDNAIAEAWARANIDRLPFLYLKPLRNNDGDVAQTGPVFTLTPPEVPQTAAALLQLTASDLTEDDDTAQQVRANVSAEAMDIAAQRVDAKSAIYLDNMRQSMQRCAEIYLAMARDVYFEAGRKVDTLADDGAEGKAELVEPAIDKQGVYRIRNDLSRGRYKVVADVQEATATRRQKTVRDALNMAGIATSAQDMQLAQAAILTAAMNMDGEGIQDLHRYARQRGLAIGLFEPSEDEAMRMQEQAAQQAEPSPADQALMAQARNLQSDAQLKGAQAVEKLATAALRQAQAQAVGGPVQAPEAPTGLEQPESEARIAESFASADLKRAQAERLRRENDGEPQ